MHSWRVRSIALVLLLAAPVSAQVEIIEVPEPPAEPDDGALNDDALIRWAVSELRVHRGEPNEAPRAALAPAEENTGAPAIARVDRSDAVRVLAEIGGGTVGFAIGGGLGILLLWAADQANASPDWMLIAGGVGTVLGALGVTTGVVLAAESVGGRGNFGHAFLGQAIGSLVALPIVVLGLQNDAPELSIVAAGILPLAGAVLAYEISHGDQGAVAFVGPTGIAGTIP